MIFGSVCSGIEAASVAWKPLGWRAAFLSEIEAFPRAVLAHHYSGTPLHGDFITIQAGQYEPIDLLVGGTPCQSFSVAGLRGGLADERGNLALEYLRLAQRLRPRWLLWENVPGVLSSTSHDAPDPCQPPDDMEEGAEWVGEDEYDADESHAFSCFLAGLSELGYGFAYRVLDAQFFGLAQRRNRVFVVGYLGDWRRAAAVLFEPASLRWNPPPRREERQGTTGTLSARASAGGGLGTDFECSGGVVAQPVANTLMVPSHGAAWKGDGYDNLVAHALRADGFDASEDGTGRGTPLVACGITIHGTDKTASVASMTDLVGALRARAPGGQENSSTTAVLAFDLAQMAQITSATNRTTVQPGQPTSTLNGSGAMHMASRAAVRRLTPEECEALQGFPRGYTDVSHRGKQAADGPRYRALGNSMAVPCMAWIGRRIAAQEAEIRASQQAAA